MESQYKLIGKNVKRVREQNKLSQLQLANTLGHKSVSLIGGAEKYYNKQHLNIEHLIKYAHIFECEIWEFFKPIS